MVAADCDVEVIGRSSAADDFGAAAPAADVFVAAVSTVKLETVSEVVAATADASRRSHMRGRGGARIHVPGDSLAAA